MGLELELSELAVIRSIRTAVSSADDPTPTRPDSDGDDAAGTGWVTPTAVTSLPQQGDVDDNSTGCVTPTATIPTTPRRGVVVVVDAICVTPTSASRVLRPSTECPPAPRKPARSPVPKRKLCGGGPAPRRCFFPVPRDLTKVFVARGPADSSPPQAAKKIRVHPVG